MREKARQKGTGEGEVWWASSRGLHARAPFRRPPPTTPNTSRCNRRWAGNRDPEADLAVVAAAPNQDARLH